MKKTYILLLLFFTSFSFVNAQVDKTIRLCEKYLVPPFISDGQEYRSLHKYNTRLVYIRVVSRLVSG